MTTAEAIEGARGTANQVTGRIISVDALRGFDMFWIIGADSLVRALGKVTDSAAAKFFAHQLRHAPWEGFTFYDLIFPLFVFLAGMSVVFSLSKLVDREGVWAAHKRIVRRFVLLFLLGAFRDGGLIDLAGESPFSGVLQRIAWCYLITGLLYCHFRLRGLIVACLAILIGYWALLSFVPVPGRDTVSFEKHENIANYIDAKYLPFKERGQRYDPEGLLSTAPAVGSCLLGVFAALLLRERRIEDKRKVAYLIGCGAAMVVVGFLWGLQFPVIKRIWTSSYVLVAGGYSAILLGLFYLIVDVRQYRKWAQPFIWIGANPLTIYLADEFVNFQDLGGRLVGGPVAQAFGKYDGLLITAVGLVIAVLFTRFLYNRKIFLRV